MSHLSEHGTRKLQALPWGPLDGSSWGHGGQSSVIIALGGSNGTRRSSTVSAAPSGLTRRGVVYEYIRRHPGTHVRGMAKGLRLATGDLQYHLNWLEKNGFVKTKKSEFYRFVYPTMVFNEEQEVLLGVLSQESPREILLHIVQLGPMTQGELARSLGHSQPTVSWHIDRLVQVGVVVKKASAGGSAYELAADRDDVLRFVESYHPDVWKKWAPRLGATVSEPVKRADKRQSLQRARIAPSAAVGLVGIG